MTVHQLTREQSQRWCDPAEHAFREAQRTAAITLTRRHGHTDRLIFGFADIVDADGRPLESFEVNRYEPRSRGAHRQAARRLDAADDRLREGLWAHEISRTTQALDPMGDARTAFYDAANDYVRAASIYLAGLTRRLDDTRPPSTVGLPATLGAELCLVLETFTDDRWRAADLLQIQHATVALRTIVAREAPELFDHRPQPVPGLSFGAPLRAEPIMTLTDSETQRWRDSGEETFREALRAIATAHARETHPERHRPYYAAVIDPEGHLVEAWAVSAHEPHSLGAARHAAAEIALGDDRLRHGAMAHDAATTETDDTARHVHIDDAHFAYYEAADHYLHAASLYHAGHAQHIDDDVPSNTIGLRDPLRSAIAQSLRHFDVLAGVGPLHTHDVSELTRVYRATSDLRVTLERASPELFTARIDPVHDLPGTPTRDATAALIRPDRTSAEYPFEPGTPEAIRAAQREVARGDAFMSRGEANETLDAIDRYIAAVSLYYTGGRDASPHVQHLGLVPLPKPIRTLLAQTSERLALENGALSKGECDHLARQIASAVRDRIVSQIPDILPPPREPSRAADDRGDPRSTAKRRRRAQART